MHPSLSHPDTSPFVRYLRESGEVEVAPCSTSDVVHMETLRLRVNNWLGRPDQLGVGFFYRIVNDVSVYFGLAVISQNRRKLVLGLRFTDGTPSDPQAPNSIDWKTRLSNARKDISRRYALGPLLPGFPIPYPGHTANGYKGQHGRRLKSLLEKERQLCWQQRIAEASEQLEFTPLIEREEVLCRRLSTLSAPDSDLLYTLAGAGKLFTKLASECGISSGGWILACDRYNDFNRLDFHLYWWAIEPQIEAWINSVERARKKLSVLAQRE